MSDTKKNIVYFMLILITPSILSCSSDMSIIFMQNIAYETASCLKKRLKLIDQGDNIFSINEEMTYKDLKYKKEKKIMTTSSGFNLYIFYTWKSKETKLFLKENNLKLVNSDLDKTTDYISKTGCLKLKQWNCFDEVDNVACKHIKNKQ
jgi:hypothetical protein